MRFIPRFSLRFAWLALTIFLIVFALGASRWKRTSAYEASLERLVAGDYAIEEIEAKWLGYFDEKRVIGLITPFEGNTEQLQAFLELPRPEELRGLWLRSAPLTPEAKEMFFVQLERCTALERLYLPAMQLNASQAKRLHALKKLRILNLQGSTLPAGSQTFLSAMPDLEFLNIDGNGYSLEQFEQLPATKLCVLQTANCAGSELRLTKTGFGRFANLEILTFERSPFDLVSCEAGALPQLEVLGIPDVAKPGEIAWHILPDTTPKLRALAIHPTQFHFASREQIDRMPKLRRLMFFAGKTQSAKGLTWVYFNSSWVLYRSYFKQEIEEFIQAHPRIFIELDFQEFLDNSRSPQLDLSLNNSGHKKPHWDSNHWIKSTIEPRVVLHATPRPAPIVVAAPVPSASLPPGAPSETVDGSSVLGPIQTAPPTPAAPPEPAWLKNFGPERD